MLELVEIQLKKPKKSQDPIEPITQEKIAEIQKKKSKKGKLSLTVTIILCLFLGAIVIVGSILRDTVFKKDCETELLLKDLSLECLNRPFDTVLKNVDGMECMCQNSLECDTDGCLTDSNGNPSCCFSPQQQCIVYSSDGTKKSGCCVANLNEEGKFFCNPNSKSCTRQCPFGTIEGSGCRNGYKKYCCEYENGGDVDTNPTGWCSISGPCTPCLHGTTKVENLTPCTNADGSNRADACCYNGECILKSCPKQCTVQKLPAHEGQVCTPSGSPIGSGCCNNGTCISIQEPSGVCPSPCRNLDGEIVAETTTCATLDGEDNGVCVKSFCVPLELPVVVQTTPTIIPFENRGMHSTKFPNKYLDK